MSGISKARLVEIMSDDDIGGSKLHEDGDNALKGLLIIDKYMPGVGITWADRGVIYSADVDDLINAGISEDDAVELRSQNWMIEHGKMSVFV